MKLRLVNKYFKIVFLVMAILMMHSAAMAANIGRAPVIVYDDGKFGAAWFPMDGGESQGPTAQNTMAAKKPKLVLYNVWTSYTTPDPVDDCSYPYWPSFTATEGFYAYIGVKVLNKATKIKVTAKITGPVKITQEYTTVSAGTDGWYGFYNYIPPEAGLTPGFYTLSVSIQPAGGGAIQTGRCRFYIFEE